MSHSGPEFRIPPDTRKYPEAAWTGEDSLALLLVVFSTDYGYGPMGYWN